MVDYEFLALWIERLKEYNSGFRIFMDWLLFCEVVILTEGDEFLFYSLDENNNSYVKNFFVCVWLMDEIERDGNDFFFRWKIPAQKHNYILLVIKH